jgi:hypothetical protein
VHGHGGSVARIDVSSPARNAGAQLITRRGELGLLRCVRHVGCSVLQAALGTMTGLMMLSSLAEKM